MRENPQNQRGSIHIVIVVILILVILSALGFVLWGKLHNKTQTSSTNATSTAKTVTSAPQYLDLADWSVKFTVPTGLSMSDIVDYETHVGEAPEYYGFTTNRVQAQGNECRNQVSGNLVVLNRSTTQQTGMGTLISSGTIGGYYYYLDDTDGGISPMPTCLTTNIAVQDHALLDKLVKSLVISETTVPIKELGLSITVPDSIKDLTYAYSSSNGSSSASLSTKVLTETYSGCEASGVAPPLGALEKFQGQYDSKNPYIQLAKQLPSYYIGWQNSQAPCSSTQIPNLDTLLTALHNSFSTIKSL